MNIIHLKFPDFRFFTFFILILCSQPVHAVFSTDAVRTLNLAETEPGWTAVLGGKAVCEPVKTSYGFAVLLDGRMLCACTEKGKVLWQKQIQGLPQPFLTVTNDDFMYTVSNKHMLSLFNPSGLLLWSADVPSDITQPPLAGRDGRVFLYTENHIFCYGLNGICKWNIGTAILSSDLSLQELNDGSILAFIAGPSSTKSEALRISPFGTIIEKITFSGTVTAAASFNTGVLLTFSSGTVGMCSVPAASTGCTASAVTAWSLQSLFPAGTIPAVVKSGNSQACIACTGPTGPCVTVIHTDKGKILSRLLVSDIDVKKLVYSSGTDSDITLSDSEYAVNYTISTASTTGKAQVRWKAALPEKSSGTKSWNYIYYTQQGTLILCQTSWALSGYRMIQPLSYTKETATQETYDSFLEIAASSPDTQTASEELASGGYAESETVWTRSLLDAADSYISFREQKLSNIREDITDFDSERLLYASYFRLMGKFGTTSFTDHIASLVRVETDPSMLSVLASAAGECAYDPDGHMLDALTTVLLAAKPAQTELLKNICDAVYDICRFMGRPAFNHKGKNMLARMLFSGYNNKTSAYARMTLSKIASLEM